MADTKLTALSAITPPITVDDLAYLVDDPSGTPTSKKVTVAALRDFFNLTYSAYSTDANLAAAVNTLYYANIAGFSANRTLTLPGTAAVGDRVALFLGTGDDTYAFLVTATAGDTLNGIAGGSEWSRLFIANEFVVFRCVVANTTWIVETDRRISSKAQMRLTTSTAGTSETISTNYKPTAKSGVWTASIDNASLSTVATGTLTVRRTGNYKVSLHGVNKNVMGDATILRLLAYLNGSTRVLRAMAVSPAAASASMIGSVVGLLALAAGDYLEYYYNISEADIGILACENASSIDSSFAIEEQL